MKKNKKVSINLTEEEFDLLNALAKLERRNISELAALIVVDTSRAMFLDKQEKGTLEVAHFYGIPLKH
jgi:hypothetical protein